MLNHWLISSKSSPRIAGALTLAALATLTAACSTADLGQGSSGGATASESGGSNATGPGSGSATDPYGTSGWDPSGTSGGTSPATTTDATSGSPSDSAGGTTGGGEEPPPEDDEQNSSSGAESTGGEEKVCDAETPVVLYLSPDDSNSTSSPVQVREAVLQWGSLNYAPVRTWEFLNYYSFNYEAAKPGMVTVTPELARIEGMPDNQIVVQIGVASETVANPDRPLMNITMVLDESGSMGGHPIEMERAVCRAIAGSLRAGDVVSMVGWDTQNAVKLAGHAVTGPNDAKVVAVCDGLEAGGGTDLNGGLIAGYDLAKTHFDAKRINRVVLVSDGGANAGVTDKDLIADGAGSQDKDGIYLVGVGVGTPDTYNDELMDTVTDVGRGASLFIPSEAEAKKMFGARFVQTMAVAARDVRVRLDLPPGFEIVKFSGEEFSSDPSEIEPQHLAPNDAMVFHQTVETCAPDLVDDAASFTVAVRWRDAITFEDREEVVTRPIKESLQAETPMLKKGAAVFAYAEALKVYRDTPGPAALMPAFDALARAEEALPGDPDLAEIRQILEAL